MIKNVTKLLEEQKSLTKEFQELEKEKKDAETIITCQTRKSEIAERQKEIEYKLYEIERKLSEEREEYGERNNNILVKSSYKTF